ncbi:SsrA-binding protein SmpB [Anaerofustis sp.]|uniref:SsrA-binding protein SmpB n=1 Tax=Anaerofustis sp. TaxID=1872517 RepID=UPI0025C59314|nr:SsrA-binding protein SmpB [Anaerofustis sp.]
MGVNKNKDDKKIIAKNKKAHFEYHIIETYEAGLELKGTEVKSIRNGKVNLKDSYANVDKNNEVFIIGMHISPYEFGNINNVDPLRERKLLLNKREIRHIKDYLTKDGYTLIPLDLHFNKSYVKMNIAICKGKKLYDKRESLKEKAAKREMDRSFKISHR